MIDEKNGQHSTTPQPTEEVVSERRIELYEHGSLVAVYTLDEARQHARAHVGAPLAPASYRDKQTGEWLHGSSWYA
jgi:hypothetical protein